MLPEVEETANNNLKSVEMKEATAKLKEQKHGAAGNGINGDGDRSISAGAPVPHFVATIPVSFFHRFVPSSTERHLYAAVMGAVLSYLSFGFTSNLHFLVPMLLGYASMVISRPYCGIITFFIAFGYLIGCHVYYMSGDAWKEGIGAADGLLKEEELREAQKKNRLLKGTTSLLEYFGYCLCCGSHFAGPIWESSEKGHPSPLGATLRALLQAAFCMGLYLYLVPFYPLSSGWTDSSPPKPRWDRAKNVDILGVELAKSSVQLPLYGDIQVSTWLRHYVYELYRRKEGWFLPVVGYTDYWYCMAWTISGVHYILCSVRFDDCWIKSHLQMAASYKRYSVRRYNVNELRIHIVGFKLLRRWLHDLILPQKPLHFLWKCVLCWNHYTDCTNPAR
ncbi:hypothetical protein HAX54_006531 [Datura stramonium]|uniref:Uncharacterized protein n=1 Tax=Datura stramonium TaxID=4076 RepID=A0ABS8RW39_DATST|nr:hypothetical protein [Datura stramonium]